MLTDTTLRQPEAADLMFERLSSPVLPTFAPEVQFEIDAFELCP